MGLRLANGCGIGPFSTKEKDSFYTACLLHDELYINNKLHGGESLRREQDDKFLEVMLALSEGRASRLKAYVYYGLARGFGWIPWYFRRSNGE